MLKPEFSGQFKRDFKVAVKRGCDSKKLENCHYNAMRRTAASS